MRQIAKFKYIIDRLFGQKQFDSAFQKDAKLRSNFELLQKDRALTQLLIGSQCIIIYISLLFQEAGFSITIMENMVDHLEMDSFHHMHLEPHDYRHCKYQSDPTQTGSPSSVASKKNKISYREIDQKNKRKGHWGNDQKKKYHIFLQIYHKHFQNRQLRRLDKIFKVMAEFIASRAADQCRSHHQKMQKKYLTFYGIIKNLRMNHYQSTQSSAIISQIQRFRHLTNLQEISVIDMHQLQTQRELKQQLIKQQPEQVKYFESFDQNFSHIDNE